MYPYHYFLLQTANFRILSSSAASVFNKFSLVSVRENVCNISKKRKKSGFLDFQKKRSLNFNCSITGSRCR